MMILLLLLISCFQGLSAHIQSEETPAVKCLRPHEGEILPCGLPGIDALYVINLDKRPEKWSRMKSLLSSHGLSPTRFSAINGWELPLGVQIALMWPYKRMLNGGRIGCILSHLSVIKDAYDRGFEVVWVMEDDVEILEEVSLISEMIDILYRIDSLWDIFYTDIDTKGPSGERIPSLGMDIRPDQHIFDLDYYTQRIVITPDIQEIRQRFGMYSYLVSRRGMKKILDHFTHVYLWSPWDIDIHYIPGIREYSTTRDIVSIWYQSGISDTENCLHALVMDHLIEPPPCGTAIADIPEPR